MSLTMNHFIALVKTASRKSTHEHKSIRNIPANLSQSIRMASVAFAICFTGFGQLEAQAYEGQPCTQGNPGLKREIQSGQFSGDYHWAFLYGDAQFATSFLKAEGKAPKKKTSKELEDDHEGNTEYDAWTCMYSAYKAQDGDTKTAWAEGVKGTGIGEVLMVPVDAKPKTRIWIGFGKNQALFTKNSRPKKVKLTLFQPTDGDVSEVGTIFRNLKRVGTLTVDLKDVNGWQDLPLPQGTSVTLPSNRSYLQDSRLLAIEILEVYLGTHYDDTLITEVER